jgi:hypothetical protein
MARTSKKILDHAGELFTITDAGWYSVHDAPGGYRIVRSWNDEDEGVRKEEIVIFALAEDLEAAMRAIQPDLRRWTAGSKNAVEGKLNGQVEE